MGWIILTRWLNQKKKKKINLKGTECVCGSERKREKGLTNMMRERKRGTSNKRDIRRNIKEVEGISEAQMEEAIHNTTRIWRLDKAGFYRRVSSCGKSKDVKISKRWQKRSVIGWRIWQKSNTLITLSVSSVKHGVGSITEKDFTGCLLGSLPGDWLLVDGFL